jgi:hypothetical protein
MHDTNMALKHPTAREVCRTVQTTVIVRHCGQMFYHVLLECGQLFEIPVTVAALERIVGQGSAVSSDFMFEQSLLSCKLLAPAK